MTCMLLKGKVGGAVTVDGTNPGTNAKTESSPYDIGSADPDYDVARVPSDVLDPMVCGVFMFLPRCWLISQLERMLLLR